MLRNFLMIVLLLPCHSWAQEVDSIAVRFAETITAKELKEHLSVLASDEYEGRETGKKGQKKAAQYITDYFKELGFSPVMGNYQQPYPLSVQYPEGIGISLDGKDLEFKEDFYFFPGFKDEDIQADEILFLGYGIEDENYNDYEGQDVEGKVLLILDNEPKDEEGKSLITGEKKPSAWTINWRKKLQLAREKGVKALFIVNEDFKLSLLRYNYYITQPSYKLILNDKKKEEKENLPVFYITADVANNLLSRRHKVEKVQEKIRKKKKPYSKRLKTGVDILMNRRKDTVVAENVLGYLPGSDLKDELIVITAHYDHLGKMDGKIYNGADDDGSGTVTVLELAEAFKKAKEAGHGPRRSILFMLVSGEEKGLFGSEYYVNNPFKPLDQTIANLNIDMIGRTDEQHDDSNYVYLIGSDRLSTELHEISENTNATYTKLDLDYTYNDPDDPNRFYYRSDHYNFASNNIPVIFYFSGVHEDYHQPTDTVDKIMFGKMTTIGRLVFYTAWQLANRDDRIVVDVVPEEE